MNILLTSTDIAYASLLSQSLKSKGFHVDSLSNTDLIIERLQEAVYDLAIVDCAANNAAAMHLVGEFREVDETLPVIVIGSKDEKEDICQAYRAGADEYVTKPYDIDVLVCKINSWLRRPQLALRRQQTKMQIGIFTLDTEAQTLSHNTTSQHLSVKENEVLALLAQNINKVVEKRFILRRVWKTDSYFAQRSLSVYVNHIKHYLEDDPDIQIQGLRGRGYKLNLKRQ